MFTLTNAGRQLREHPWRTLLIVCLSLLVTLWSMFGAAIMHDYNSAHTTQYNELQPQAVVRMTNTTRAEHTSDNSKWTDRYLTWEEYNVLAAAAQAKQIEFTYTALVSVPVRTTSAIKPVTSSTTKDVSNQNATGGNLTLQSLFTQDAFKANEYGNIKIVDGSTLNFESITDRTVLVSQQFAKVNNLKVGSTINVANPTNAQTTYQYKVAGIYAYTDNPEQAQGDTAQFAKDNRNNVLYTSYYTFAADNLDSTDATGWARPDINIVFSLKDPATYEQFAQALDSNLPKGYAVTSPTIRDFLASLKSLDSLASTTRIMLILVWSIGAMLLLILVLLEVIPRRKEIGMAMSVGVSRGRLFWQFMLEVLIQIVPAVIIGVLLGRFCPNPLQRLAGDHALTMTNGTMWTVIWIALTACFLCALTAGLRITFFRTAQLTHRTYTVDELGDDNSHEQEH